MNQSNPRRRAGMTLVELLISLAISTALLVALAAAFQASSGAVESNDSYFHCTQTARAMLERMVTEVRRADAVQVSAAGDALEVIQPAEQLSPNEIYRRYAYDAPQKRVTLQVFFASKTSGPVVELATNISACTFGPADSDTDSSNAAVAVRIPISITCAAGGHSVTLNGARNSATVAAELNIAPSRRRFSAYNRRR